MTRFEKIQAKAIKGNAVAQLKMGCMYYCGIDVEEDLNKASYWLYKASKNDNNEAKVLQTLNNRV